MPSKIFRKNWLYFILIISMFFMIIAPAAAAVRPIETQSVIIGFNNFPLAAERGLLRANNAKVLKEYSIIPAMLVEVPVQAINGLKRNPLVDYVEADAPVYAVTDTVDWGVYRVKAPEVWNLATPFTGAGVKVAVLDTGIGPHEDLAVKGGVSFVGGKNYNDGNGHGTHVAGTIAALHNGFGVAGIAPAAELYAVKVLNNGGSGTISGIISGIDWAVKNGMDIINMSLGSAEPTQSLENACNAAYNKGVLLVAAAGNSGNAEGTDNSVIYPARYESVIAVAATDSSDNKAYFSSTGSTVELSAPGVQIYSTYKNNYAYLSGTSMASPHVAGVAALVMSANNSLVNLQVRKVLTDTATNLAMPDSHGGRGLVNALAAVELALESKEQTYTVSGTIMDTNNIGISGASVTVGQNSYTADGSGKYSLELIEGYYTFTASAPGYVSKTREQILVGEYFLPIIVDFNLEKSTQALMTNNLILSTKTYARFTDLLATVNVVSDGTPVTGAVVNLEISRTNGDPWSLTGTTNSDGTVAFTQKKVSSGTYTVKVLSISHDLYDWDFNQSIKDALITVP